MRNNLLKILVFGLLLSNTSIANDLINAAKERLKHKVIYDGSYQKIAYPMGDVSDNKGVCTDVVIRAYRQIGIDLQELVHVDMKARFSEFPSIWGLRKPDSNIDHRRVPNLEVFFAEKGESLAVTKNKADYKSGDIVTWRLNHNNLPHIGVVSDVKSASGTPLIIHNIGMGPQMNDMLFAHKIVGHYRYLSD